MAAKIDKEDFYFPHFANARNDRKLKRLVKNLGLESYGVFFILLEILREQTYLKYPFADIDLIADDIKCDEEKLVAIVKDYGLFEMDDDGNFYSPKQIEYLMPYFEKSKRAQHAANVRWGKTADANALRSDTISNTGKNARRGEERRVEESKGEEKRVKESILTRTREKKLPEIIPINNPPILGQNEDLLTKFWNLYPEGKGKRAQEVELYFATEPRELLARAIEDVPVYIEYMTLKDGGITYALSAKKYLKNSEFEEDHKKLISELPKKKETEAEKVERMAATIQQRWDDEHK